MYVCLFSNDFLVITAAQPSAMTDLEMDTSQLGVVPDQGLPEMLLDTDVGDKEMSETVAEPSAEGNTAESVDLPASLLIPDEGDIQQIDDSQISPQDVPVNETDSPSVEENSGETLSIEKLDSSQSESNSVEQKNDSPTEPEALPESVNDKLDDLEENMEVETQPGTLGVDESLPVSDNQLEPQTSHDHNTTNQNTEPTDVQKVTETTIPSGSNSPSNVQDVPVAPSTHEPENEDSSVGHIIASVERSDDDRPDEGVVTSEVIKPEKEEVKDASSPPQDGQQVPL